ncbi:MAG: phosphoadenosine phosphosulfate reductase family protein [Gammaproteobacteria bacterium]|nr:phosphoadenosine phosphosulfate reductase family protein [Gammaproteobacteria bacterium]
MSDKAPADIAAWALSNSERPMVSTSFGLHAAAMLHLVTRLRPDIPVVWIDTGFNTPDTYRHAELLTRALGLNLRIYAPDVTRARLEAALGGVPSPESPERHAEFSDDIKLKPFRRALAELAPDLWLSGIRREETEWRQSQDIVTRSGDGLLKVAPFFYASEADVEAYMKRFSLPFGDPMHYDPAKAAPHRECGLHPRYSVARA